MDEKYISVDIEAAGPIPPTYSMLSLGACVVGDEQTTFYTELRPINGNSLPAAMKVAGRSLQEFERDGRAPEQAMTAFRDWLAEVVGDSTPVFVGFNAVFDWAFVNFYFHSYLGDNPFGFGGIDIKSFYMALSGCTWDDARSSRIPPGLKGASPHTHNALSDALEQAEMFRRMRDQASAR